ncbi:MAG: hypothetical protein HQL69_22920 [Magnetococcales bacterium]|nr:hypothetical protein [Magnetococcales bacterium]
MNNVFYISSIGHSATAWLATALDMHPNITCYHGIRYSPEDPQRKQVEGDVFLEQLAKKANKNHFVGSVHGYSGNHIEQKIKDIGGQYATCLRNPIFRISSVYQHHYKKVMVAQNPQQIADFEWMIKSFLAHNRLTVDVLMAAKLLRDTSVDGSPGIDGLSYTDLCFMWSVMYVAYNDFLTAQSENRVFRMEDYTQIPEAFADLFALITKQQIPLDAQYLYKVFNIGKLNSHRKEIATDVDEFKQWQPNHQMIFKVMIPFIGPKILNAFYGSLGYNFVTTLIDPA